MPLETGKSKAAFQHNIETEIAAGKPQKQAVAIAYAKQRGDAAGLPLDIDPVADAGPGPHGDSPSPPHPGEILKAAGILFMSKAGRVLLMRRTGRDFPGTWALPGGGMEEGENAQDTAVRETLEETDHKHDGPLRLWTRRVRDGVDFSTFLAKADEEFEPKLNDEHDRYQWVDKEFALTSGALHPGVPIALQRFDMDELGVARAIRDGELASPQRYANLLLVALRITGTGLAYRQTGDEYVWRDTSIYLNPEFLERCQGLAVIAEHPKKNMLDTKEFKERMVGTIMLPFIRGDEVWGVAKIHDMRCAQLLETEPMSTSPAVVFMNVDTGIEFEMRDGKTLLIEDKPSLLDHLALLLDAPGVWDKQQGLNGVDSIDVEHESIIDDALALVRRAQLDSLARQLSA